MNQKVTILNVAEQAGVSISTVHQALNGKKGVSEETRKRIQQIADDLGYHPNPLASNLKRKTRHIAVLLPNSNYHKTVWKGVRDYLSTVQNMNLDCTEFPFAEGSLSENSRQELLNQITELQPDGILITGHSSIFAQKDWDELNENGTAVSLIGADMPESHRMFCIMPDYEIIGRTMAELVLSHIPSYGSIAICAGNPIWEPHAMVVRGFEAFIHENGAPNRIYYDNTWNREEESYRHIRDIIAQPDIAACCSVLSQSSILMGRALIETGKSHHIFAVGSDLSDENVTYLKDSVFNNLIQKNPYTQGYIGAKNLAEYLTLGKKSETEQVFVGSEVVFRSNLSMYRNRSYRSLLS